MLATIMPSGAIGIFTEGAEKVDATKSKRLTVGKYLQI
jgi:hypothetical protein